MPEDVWFIGDNYACDIEGARQIGTVPVWYTGAADYGQPEHDDTVHITSWQELREIMEA